MTPKQRAQASAKAMWSDDRASAWFGMSLEDVDEGQAVLSLRIEPKHCNGHGNCHGGRVRC